MGKYQPLGDFLRKQKGERVALTFAEIERIIGVKLPKSQRYPAWWSNNPWNNVMTQVWLDAGFETEQVDVQARKLVFRRSDHAKPSSDSPRQGKAGPAPRQHPLIGCMKGTVWIAPGTDLTQPACPEWGEVAYGDKAWDNFK